MAGTLLLLVSSRAGRLSATIRSRCQQRLLATPQRSIAEGWLAERGVSGEQVGRLLAITFDAPLSALQMADEVAAIDTLVDDLIALANRSTDAATVVGRWDKGNKLRLRLEWLYSTLADAVRSRHDKTVDSPLAGMIDVAPAALLEFQHQVLQTAGELARNSGLNATLLTEALLIEWQKINQSSRSRR